MNLESIHTVESPNDYQNCLLDLIQIIRQNKSKAIAAVNEQWLRTCWEIGKIIEERKALYGWGAGVIENLSRDLKAQFPNERGYSVRNLKYMMRFYNEFPEIRQPLAAQLSFSHFVEAIAKTRSPEELDFYIG